MSEFESYGKGPLERLTPELMQGYVDGTLPEDLMRRVQAYLEENPFEAEAMEGIKESQGDFSGDLSDVENRLASRVGPVRGRSFQTWWRIAAVILLLAVSGVVIYYFLPGTNSSGGLAVEQELVEDQEEPTFELDNAHGQTEDPSILDNEGTGSQQPATTAGSPKEHDVDKADPSPTIAEPETSTAAKNSEEEEILADDIGAIAGEVVLAEAAEYDLAEDVEAAPAARSSTPSEAAPKSPPLKEDGYLSLGDTAEIPFEFKVVVGKVTNYQSGNPVPGANIAIKGTDISTFSDQNGFFHLEAPLDAQSLISSNVGFRTSEVTISEEPQIDVVLNENSSVPQTLANQRKKRANKESEAQLGAADEKTQLSDKLSGTAAAFPSAQAPDDLDSHLREYTQYPPRARELAVEGDVWVAFKVLPDGSLTDFEILKKLGFGCDEAAVRALQSAPPWIPAKRNGKAVISQGQYRVKFPPHTP